MSSEAWLISGATLIDGTGGTVRERWSVVVDGAAIGWIGPDAAAPPIDHTRIVEAKGRVLVPGLINAHVHLANDGSADLAAQVREDSVPTAALRAAANARDTLRSGVTSVRDCGASNGVVVDLGRAISSGLAEGPRVVAAGRVITMTGGHGHFMGREVDGVDAVTRAVRAELHDGASFIKAMATGGVLTRGVAPGRPALVQEELLAVTRTAHDAGRKVATHAIGRTGIRNALLAGVDSIEHGFYLDDELFQIAIDRGTFLVPTLLAIRGIVDDGPEGGSPTWIIDKAAAESERSTAMFRDAVAAGMRVAAGTDAGTPFNPHTDLARELELMVGLGMPPLAVIRAATLDAAELLGIDDVVGSIEVGKHADLLLADGDPLLDMTVLRRPALVVKEGRLVAGALASTPHGRPAARIHTTDSSKGRD